MKASSVAISVALLVAPSVARADAFKTGSDPENGPFRIGVEVDPRPFFASGDSEHLAWRPGVHHLRFTVGTYGTESTSDGWTTRTRAFEASIEGFFIENDSLGAFAGVMFFAGRRIVTNDVENVIFRGGKLGLAGPPEARVQFFVPALLLGGRWIPFRAGPYLAPWLAFGPEIHGKHQSPMLVHGEVRDAPSVAFVTGLHVGVELPL